MYSRIRYITFSILLALLFGVPSLAQVSSPDYDGIIVKTRSGLKKSRGHAFLGKAQAEKSLKLEKAWHGMGMYNFKMQKNQKIQDVISDLQNDPDVEYAEPDYILKKANVGEVNVLSAAEVSSMNTAYKATGAPIQAPNAWPIVNANASNVPVVAVIDTGLDINHNVFKNSNALWRNTKEIPGNGIDDDGNGYVDDVYGWNFVSNSPNMIDDDGHGTHVAGTVLAVTQDIFLNPIGQAKIRIMPLKFLNANGSGKTSDAIEAIYYAVENGATILNNSWGGPGYSAALHEAVTYAYNRGVIFVAAAGNSASNNDQAPMYPASYAVPNVIAVAATTDFDNLASFSNFGKSSVLLGSPGWAILSTYPGNQLATMYGTSMASPFVAGTAALMKMEAPDLLGFQAKQIIAQASDYKSSLQTKVNAEARLNVLNSVSLVKTATIESSQPSYSFTASRGTASSAGGCGTVTKLYSEMNKGGGDQGGGAEPWQVFLVVLFVSLPLVAYNILRSRSPENRRQFERFKIATDVKVNVGGKELIGSLSSISLGGAQVNTAELLDQGGIIQLSIQSPDGKDIIQVEGKVVWSEAQKAYGVQFQGAGQPALAAISAWTKNLTKL
jgi:subtilisin family serine protease